MRLHLGLHLDGQRGWHPANRLGQATVGPLGLLGILETQLGLLRNHASAPERIVQYRNCLKRCDAPTRFYHRTFNTDELGTAATLLAWRDQWRLYGWNGQLATASSGRLRDLHDVEQVATGTVAPGIGERLIQVTAALAHCRSGIGAIELHDPAEAFPQRWQTVLALLPCTPPSPWGAAGAGILGDLQRALLAQQAGQAVAPVPWQNDGSLVVVQAETRLLAGRVLAAQMDNRDTLLVAPAAGALLDDIHAAAGVPRQGLRDASAFRPTLQVLPLALEILWEPINFYGLLQFLTHPVCPVAGFARRKLAGKLADRPGIGGEAWKEALNDICEHYGKHSGDKVAGVLDSIRHWIEHPRYDPRDGAPLAAVLERVERLVAFFRARLGDTDPAQRIAYHAGFAQCRACADSLRGLLDQGMARISAHQLQKLVAQTTARGNENPLLHPEVGAQPAITDPAAALEHFDRVVWWQMAMPAMPAPYPWSPAELADLAAAGVTLPNLSTVLERTARDWMKPILAARHALVLVLPPPGVEVHPAWQMVKTLIKGIPVAPLDALTLAEGGGQPAIIHCPLPQRKRWWVLEGVQVPLRATESFSSLELFVFNPYQWLLRYPAKLQASRILEVSNDFLLFGNLAHGLIERFFLQCDALGCNDSRSLAWFEANFDQIVKEEGAVLLMPGRRSDLEGFRMRLREALMELRRHVKAAGVKTVEPELKLEGSFSGGAISGYADLVFSRGKHELAIVDMKWAGGKKYPDKLKQNRALQLAIYGELLRQKRQAWPKVAYYILNSAELYAANTDFFPSAQTVIPQTDEGLAECWMRLVETWSWRRKQADAGRFEVALEGIPEDETSVPPDKALAMEVLNANYNEFSALAGWEQ